MIGIGWHAMDIPLTFLQLAGFALRRLVVITYCLMIIRRAFILVRPDGLCVGDRSFRLGRQQFPYGYIPGLGPADRDFVIPLFLITNFGPMFLLGQINWLHAGLALSLLLLLYGRSGNKP